MGKKRKVIRTPSGICLGDGVPIEGKRGVHIQQGGKTEDLLPEQIVECITGRNVQRIIYEDESGAVSHSETITIR